MFWHASKWVAVWQDVNCMQGKTWVLPLTNIAFWNHHNCNTCTVQSPGYGQYLCSTMAASVFALLIFSKDCDRVELYPERYAEVPIPGTSECGPVWRVFLQMWLVKLRWGHMDKGGPLLQCTGVLKNMAMWRQTHTGRISYENQGGLEVRCKKRRTKGCW